MSITCLFVTEKYCRGPGYGPTNNVHNLIGSYECAGLGTYDYVQTDPDAVWSSAEIDQAILSREYDAIILSVHHPFPSRAVAERFADRTVFCWWDSIMSMNGVMQWCGVNKQLCFDWGKGEERPNVFCVEVPQDTRIFYPDKAVVEDIDVSFIGSPWHDRSDATQRLRGAGLNVVTAGGRGPGYSNLSIDEYAQLFRRSKICLNFMHGHGQPQRKGRTFEIAACGQFMMANNCFMLGGKDGTFFDPEVEYASFDDGNLIPRVKYFLEHPDERERMADLMYAKYVARYSPDPFWRRVLGMCGVCLPRGRE